MNKIGICEWTLPVTGPYVCKFASELGYDGLQLSIGSYEKRFPLSRRVTQHAYKEMAADYGVEFASMATRTLDFYSLFATKGSEEHEVARQSIEKGIYASEALGIEVFMIPNFVRSEARTDEDVRKLVEELQWACDLAADHGVVIAEENVFSVEDTLRLFDEVDRENLRLYFDLQNYYLHKGVNTPDIIEPLLPHIVQVHAKDGKNGDLSGAPLGDGHVSLLESLEVLKTHEYDGWIVNENYYDVPPLVGEDDDPVEKIRTDLATLRKALE
jgi:sugar phosphate isomerase/epimerase